MAAAAAAGLAQGLRSLSAPLGDGSAPVSPSSTLPRLPGGAGRRPNRQRRAGRAPSAGAAVAGCKPASAPALITQRTLVLLRLARRAAAKSIWRSYLPEVPPA